MGRFLGITVKRLALVGVKTGTLKNPTKCLWRWETDSRSNFFSPLVHLCAVTCITEILLIVTLSNQHTHEYDRRSQPRLMTLQTTSWNPTTRVEDGRSSLPKGPWRMMPCLCFPRTQHVYGQGAQQLVKHSTRCTCTLCIYVMSHVTEILPTETYVKQQGIKKEKRQDSAYLFCNIRLPGKMLKKLLTY